MQCFANYLINVSRQAGRDCDPHSSHGRPKPKGLDDLTEILQMTDDPAGSQDFGLQQATLPFSDRKPLLNLQGNVTSRTVSFLKKSEALIFSFLFLKEEYYISSMFKFLYPSYLIDLAPFKRIFRTMIFLFVLNVSFNIPLQLT